VTGRRFTDRLIERSANADDLGWYTALLVESGAGTNAPAVIERVIRLGATGLLGPQAVAKVLTGIPGVDLGRVVRLLDRMAVAGSPRREVWNAMALCREDGLDRLERAVTEEAVLDGAATVLFDAAPDRAVSALRDRIIRDGRPIDPSDHVPLTRFDEHDVRALVDRVRVEPSRATAQMLGWTEHPLARAELLDDKWRTDPDPAVREAVVNGLRALNGGRADRETDLAIIRYATEDSSEAVRMAARTTAEIRAQLFPSVQVWLHEALPEHVLLADAVSEPGDWTDAMVADRLRRGGSGLRIALELVIRHRALRAVDEIKELVDRLADRATAGAYGIEVVDALQDLLGPPFIARCTAALREDRTGTLHPMALSLTVRGQGDEDAYLAVADYFGRFPMPLAVPALNKFALPAPRRAHLLVQLLESLQSPRSEAVRVWADALQHLQASRFEAEEPALRQRIAAATERLLAMLPDPAAQA